MAKGLSFASFAGVINVERKTLYNWVKKYPAFAKAKDVALAKRALFFEKALVDGIKNGAKSGSNALLIFALKNLGDGFSFKDRHELEHEITTPVKLVPDFGLHAEAEILPNTPETFTEEPDDSDD
jgi:hypothetical protein